jgi:hypothetical protein
MKTVYSYDENFAFVGETKAFECPIVKDSFILPANSTSVEPLKIKKGFDIIFDIKKNTWVYIEESIPEEIKPIEKTKEEILKEAIEKRNSLLYASDWTQLQDAKVDTEAWAKYRQSLRDLPAKKGFPNIEFPKQPSK